MISVAIIKALQVYGIAIAVSMIVAVLIKVMVALMGRIEGGVAKPAAKAQAAVTVRAAPAPVATQGGIPDEVVAAISGALTVVIGPHRVVRIAERSSA